MQARNLEYKNPFEEEWEKFQKEIKAVDNISAEIIAEDQEAATTERQIDEIEEQMRNWSRLIFSLYLFICLYFCIPRYRLLSLFALFLFF